MSFFRQLFRREDKPSTASRMLSQFASDHSQPASRTATAEQSTARRELLRNVLRKTLNRHGIPSSWFGAEMLIATSRGRETGMHLRLLIKHWDPRLLNHTVALQNALITRLLSFDPLAAEWLMGVSWQFALADEAQCPALPQAGYWTAEPRLAVAAPAPAVPVPGGNGDIIAGPVRIGTKPAPLAARPAARPAAAPAATPVAQQKTVIMERSRQPESSDSVRSDLDKLLAVRDAELQRSGEGQGPSDPTQPMYLKTEPQPLAAGTPRRR